MAYLTEEKFDLKEMSTILLGILPDDDSGFVTAANCKQVEAVLFTVRDHLAMRSRKRKAEEEAYRIAKEAIFGWKTEKAFRKDPVFEEDDGSDEMWWQKPELSREKKVERMRAAERDVKLQLSNRKFLLQNKFKPGPFNRSFQKRDFSFGSFRRHPQFPQVRPDTRRCFWCQGFGHIARSCPVKSQQQQQEFRNLPQLGHVKSKSLGNDK